MISTKNRTIHDTFKISDDLTGLNPSEFESNKIRSQLPMVWHKAKNFNVYDIKVGDKTKYLTERFNPTILNHILQNL